MSIDTREKLFRFSSDTNLVQIVAFHNDMKRLMQNEIVWINRAIENGGTSNLDIVELGLKKDRYLGEFLYRLRQNTFLMLFSHLEEWLFLVQDLFSGSARPDRDTRGSLKRFAPFLSENMGVDLGTRIWSILCDCSDVRDCLLHANGRLSLSKNANRLTDLANRRDFDVNIKNDRVRIGGELVLQLQRAIGDLFDQAGVAGDT